MSLLKTVAVAFLLILSTLSSAKISADICNSDSFHTSFCQRDFEAVMEFVNSKRTIPLDEKMSCLKISGDVKVEFLYRKEKERNERVRSTRFLLPNFTTEVEFDIFLNYKTDRTWSRVQLNYDDAFGVQSTGNNTNTDRQGLFGSGVFDDLSLKQAYFGWNFYNCNDEHKLNVEIGRRRLYYIFDSRIEFNDYSDGVLLEYNRIYNKDWKLFAQVLGFVVDERVNHFAWATEFGALDFMEKGIDAMYSYIDWDTNSRNRAGFKHPLYFDFRISQISGAYNFKPEKDHPWHKPARLYGAWLINHAAPSHPVTVQNKDRNGNELPPVTYTHLNRENMGWYLGFIIGEVKKKGDWSIDVNYQYVEAFSMPDREVHGIGRGNAKKHFFEIDQIGKTNYKGWHFEALYQITDCLFIDPTFEFSNQITKRFGGQHSFQKFELDLILKW